MLLTLFLVIFSLIGLYLYTHHSQRNAKKGLSRRDHKKTASDDFHCVEVHHHTHGCEAVKKSHGKRFLSAQAPILPLEGCDKAHCDCDYIHHADRRVELRRNDTGIQHELYGQNGESEHREEHHGRRKND